LNPSLLRPTGYLGFILLFFLSGFPGFSEILVYKSSVNRWSSYFIHDGSKSSWVTAPRGSKLDAYFLYDLDGTNRVRPAPLTTYRGETFKPYLIYVDHKLRTKQLKGGTPANEAENTEQTFYGRSRAAGGQRIFRMLYQQWEPNPDGSYDTGLGISDGTCQILDVGGGKSGYYAPKITGQGWRLDGWFTGSIDAYQDGLQLKYLASSSELDLGLTQAINNQSLSISEAFAFAIHSLYPAYTELYPNIR